MDVGNPTFQSFDTDPMPSTVNTKPVHTYCDPQTMSRFPPTANRTLDLQALTTHITGILTAVQNAR